MRHCRWVLMVSLVVGVGNLGGFAGLVQADDEPTDQAAILKRLDELDQEIRILKRKLELSQEDAATKGKDAPVVTTGSKDGFSIQSADKNFQPKRHGYVQTDGRFFVDDEPAASTLTMRRVRPIFDGTMAQPYDFRIMPDFGGGSATLVDACIEVGMPASSLLPNRDTGVQLFGDLLGDAMSHAASLSNGAAGRAQGIRHGVRGLSASECGVGTRQ